MANTVSTSVTLLERVRDVGDSEAWDQFHMLYAPMILTYAQGADSRNHFAQEVLQETMIDLVGILPSFTYDPGKGKFRHFLCRIVRNRIRRGIARESTSRRRRQILGAIVDEAGACSVGLPVQGRALGPREAWEYLWQLNLYHLAMKATEKRVRALTYRSFELYVLQGKSVVEVSAELKISADQVYQHKRRVNKILQQELEKIKKIVGEE